jgi:hypothetical protein
LGHGKEVWESWFHGDQVQIAGFTPIQVGPSDKNVIALKTDEIEKTVKEAYLKNLKVFLHGIPILGSDFEPNFKTQDPKLVLPNGTKLSLLSPLPEGIGIENRPLLLFLQDSQKNTHLVALDQSGAVHYQSFLYDEPGLLAVYDEGFLGYAAIAKVAGYPLESPLLRKVIPLTSPDKWEERREIVEILLEKEGAKERVSLVFDPTANGLKVAALHGRYLLCCRPKSLELPYHLRLRRARQISYPGTLQPQSYECDLFITDRRDGKVISQRLMMNQVWESADGWRFYLSGLTPKDESGIKRVHLAVNYDPVKYWLTYPGGGCVALGIVLLLFGKKSLF